MMCKKKIRWWKFLGDYRWTSDMILATWRMAETGEILPDDSDFVYETGDSGGGFDRFELCFPDKPTQVDFDEIDISLSLKQKDDGRPKIKIDVPWYGGGMSFGSISNVHQLSKGQGRHLHGILFPAPVKAVTWKRWDIWRSHDHTGGPTDYSE